MHYMARIKNVLITAIYSYSLILPAFISQYYEYSLFTKIIIFVLTVSLATYLYSQKDKLITKD